MHMLPKLPEEMKGYDLQIFSGKDKQREDLFNLLNRPEVFPFIRDGKPISQTAFNEVARVYQHSFENNVQALHEDFFSLCWLLYQENKLVARAGIQKFKGSGLEGFEVFVAVDPTYQCQSIGRSLLPLIESWSVDNLNLQKIYANIISENVPSLSLFKRLMYNSLFPEKTLELWGREYLVFSKSFPSKK